MSKIDRIIYTFWTNKRDFSKNSFGWLDSRYHICSWIRSVNLSRKFFKEVVLYCDDETKKVLIDDLNLPFTEFHILFDKHYTQDKDFWALPKILTYNKQTKPFIHIDADVYLFKQLDDKYLNADIVIQNIENDCLFDGYYRSRINLINELKLNVPAEWHAKETNYGYNMGLFGGNDLSFIKRYCNSSIRFIHSNKWTKIKEIDPSENTAVNVIVEQYILAVMCNNYNKNPERILTNALEANLEAVQKGFVHLLSAAKRNKNVSISLEEGVKRDFPIYYEKMQKLLSH